MTVACVLGEVKKLMFPPRRAGPTFVYPFKFEGEEIGE